MRMKTDEPTTNDLLRAAGYGRRDTPEGGREVYDLRTGASVPGTLNLRVRVTNAWLAKGCPLPFDRAAMSEASS